MRIILLALSLFLTLPALAEPDRAGVQAVIARQLEAFARDDAPGAYAHAAPNIRRIFPDETGFMAMVRQGYPPVYRSRRHSFEAARELPEGGLAQEVRIEDEAGEAWLALYTLERQADGTWQITGCTLERIPTRSA